MEIYYWESNIGMGQFKSESDDKALEKSRKISNLRILYKEIESPSYQMIILFEYTGVCDCEFCKPNLN